MRKDQILKTAISRSLQKGQIDQDCATAFSVMRQCFKAIAVAELSESEKRDRLIMNLQSFLRGKSAFIDGYKREYVNKITRLAFGLKSESDSMLYEEIQAYTFWELYMYYSYFERMVEGDEYISQMIWNRHKAEQSKAAEERRAQKQAEKKIQEEGEYR